MHRSLPIALGTLALALALCGCGNSGPGGTDAGMGMPDSGPGSDAGTTEGGLSCSYPNGPYGTSVGRAFEPFTLPECNGTPYSFLNQDFCDSKVTVVSIAAGWCMPCQMESAQLKSQISDVYGPMGVRLIQVLIQDPTGAAPSQSFCNTWVSTYGLTNIELRDEIGVTQQYFPAGELPATVIVDHDGIIQYREYGTSEGLASIKAKLDQLLAM